MTATMTKNGKIIYVIGSVAIGIIALLCVLFSLIAAGVIDADQRTVVFASGSATEAYSGRALTCNEWSIKDGALKKGHHAKVTITGTQTDVGSSINHISVVILDESNGDVSDNYTLEYAPGILQVTPRPLQLQSENAEKFYDGTPLTAPAFSHAGGSVAENHTVVVSASGELTEPGEISNDVVVSVLDDKGIDRSSNYTITMISGTLRVLKREISLKSGNATKIYDGTPLSCQTPPKTDDLLMAGHTPVLIDFAEVTEAGTYPNNFAAKILDANGNDVSYLYDITCVPGQLTVTPRKLVLKSCNASKIYDALPLVCPQESFYAIVFGSLIGEDTLQVLASSSITDVGTTGNKIFASVQNAQGEDVSHNYSFEYQYGDLTVLPRALTISTTSAQKIYDGTPLSSDGFSVLSGSTVEGHTLTVTNTVSITNAGVMQNKPTCDILKDGVSVLHNYTLSFIDGKLTVLPRPLSIQTADAEKNYDGTPLTCDSYHHAASTPLVEGHKLVVEITGTRTPPGESRNEAVVTVLDENGKNVCANYKIDIKLGTLYVWAITSGNGSAPLPPDFPLMEVYSDVTADFHAASTYGKYYTGGCSWDSPGAGYTEKINGIYSANYLSGALANGRATPISFEVRNNRYAYVLPAYTAMNSGNYTIQTSEFYNSGSPSDAYSLFCYSEKDLNALLSGPAHTGALAAFEANYRTYVYQNYLSVPAVEYAFLQQIIQKNGFDKNDPNIIEKVRVYIQKAATYKLDSEKNNALDQEAHMIITFLDKYKEGVCRHYATAATLLYRTLGIPARYVTGVMASAKAGQWTTVTAKQAHAWTEVYLDGYGWITIDATGISGGSGGSGGSDSGGEGELPNSLVIHPVAASALYKQNKLHTPPNKVESKENRLDLLLNSGYTYTAQIGIVNPKSDPGYYTTEIISFRLFDPTNKDVTSTFNIRYEKGRFHIYLYEITVASASVTKQFDGTPLICEEQPTLSGGTLVSGHCFAFSGQISRTEVGSSDNAFTCKIYDDMYRDVTYLYKINYTYGKVSVTAISITIRAASATKAFDGTALTNNSYTQIGQLINGHAAIIMIEGSRTNIGRSPNRVTSVVILDSEGNDVTKNYTITCVHGTLTVTPAASS